MGEMGTHREVGSCRGGGPHREDGHPQRGGPGRGGGLPQGRWAPTEGRAPAEGVGSPQRGELPQRGGGLPWGGGHSQRGELLQTGWAPTGEAWPHRGVGLCRGGWAAPSASDQGPLELAESPLHRGLVDSHSSVPRSGVALLLRHLSLRLCSS